MNLLNCGIYCYISEQYKMVYVGETSRNFLVRYIEHLHNENTWENKDKVKLLLAQDMEFKILRVVDYREKRSIYLSYETYYSDLYIKKGYKVINPYCTKIFKQSEQYRHSTNINKKSLNINKMIYGKCLYYIIDIIAKKNDISVKEVSIWCTRYIDNKFKVDTNNRNGSSLSDKLTLEELEYLICKLLNKYTTYTLDTKIEFFQKMDRATIKDWFEKSSYLKLDVETEYCILKIKNKMNKKSSLTYYKLNSKFNEKHIVACAKLGAKYGGFSLRPLYEYICKVGKQNVEIETYKIRGNNLESKYIQMYKQILYEGGFFYEPKSSTIYKKYINISINS